MPILIEGGPKNQSVHNSFWNTLTKNSDSLALSQLWLCGIDRKKADSIAKIIGTDLNLFEVDAWNIGDGSSQTEVNNVIFNDANWNSIKSGRMVYMWVQGISFIADGLNTTRVGVSQTGAIKGLIGESRLDLNAANITFLESNVSFIDGFLRPWSVLVGYKSLKDQTLRCNIELFALEKTELTSPLKVRKSMLFRNAIPINIDQEEYNYTGDKLIERQVQFAFDRYESRVYPKLYSKSQRSPYELIGDAGYSAALLVENKYPTAQEEEAKAWFQIGSKLLPEDTIIDPKDPNKSPWQQAKDLIAKANDIAGKATGIANDVTSSVSQGLRAVGLDKAGDKVNKMNDRFQSNIVSPVTKVIGTGQGAMAAGENIFNTAKNITNSNTVAADQISNQLKTRENNAVSQSKADQATNEARDSAKANIINESNDIGQDITTMESADATILA